MRNKAFVTIVLLMLTALCGCQKHIAYHAFKHISDTGWDKTDTLNFDIKPQLGDGNYCLDAELRTGKNYPFQQLTLEVEETVYPSRERYHDMVNCEIVSEEGVIGGDGISYFQYKFHIRDLSLRQGDSLRVSLTHNMKREIMQGITDVGIRLSLPH